jgi:hypothetical protein
MKIIWPFDEIKQKSTSYIEVYIFIILTLALTNLHGRQKYSGYVQDQSSCSCRALEKVAESREGAESRGVGLGAGDLAPRGECRYRGNVSLLLSVFLL